MDGKLSRTVLGVVMDHLMTQDITVLKAWTIAPGIVVTLETDHEYQAWYIYFTAEGYMFNMSQEAQMLRLGYATSIIVGNPVVQVIGSGAMCVNDADCAIKIVQEQVRVRNGDTVRFYEKPWALQDTDKKRIDCEVRHVICRPGFVAFLATINGCSVYLAALMPDQEQEKPIANLTDRVVHLWEGEGLLPFVGGQLRFGVSHLCDGRGHISITPLSHQWDRLLREGF